MKHLITPVLSMIILASPGLVMPAHAAPVTFTANLDVVLEDSGTSDLSGIPLGTLLTGSIDDETFSGFVTGDPGRLDFSCCLTAGGLDVTDNAPLDSDAAALLNSLQDVVTFSDGDTADIINLEGDVLSDAGRIEVGLSLVYGPDTYDGEDPTNYRPDGAHLQFGLLFLLQENEAEDEDIYSALGLIDELSFGTVSDPTDPPDMPGASPIPLPAGGLLLLFALGGFGLVKRRV